MNAPELRAMADEIREVAVLAELDGWPIDRQILSSAGQVCILDTMKAVFGRIPPVGAAELLETAARILDETPEGS